MYKYLGLGLLGLFVIMVMPTGSDSVSSQTLLYGGATIIANDRDGNEFFTQTVHNQLTDEGEAILIRAIFEDGEVIFGDGTQFGSICVSTTLDATLEDETAADFDAGNALVNPGGGLCRTDGDVDNSTTGIAIIESGVFTASVSSTANFNPATIDGIAVCQANTGGAGTNSTDCEAATGDGSNANRALAIVETSDVVLAESETLTVTYTFDISSPNS